MQQSENKFLHENKKNRETIVACSVFIKVPGGLFGQRRVYNLVTLSLLITIPYSFLVLSTSQMVINAAF